jgi:hypothetical protein
VPFILAGSACIVETWRAASLLGFNGHLGIAGKARNDKLNIIYLILLNMKRMIFLMLILLIMSVASMNAQVLIGEGEEPDPSAVLELRSDNGGLLLPQVKLNDTDDTDELKNPESGMLVCNLEGDLKRGVYYWNGNQWTLFIDLGTIEEQ